MSLLALIPGLLLAAAASAPPVESEHVRRAVEVVYADGEFQGMPAEVGEVVPEGDDASRPWWESDDSSSGSGTAGGGAGGNSRRSSPPGSSGNLSGLISFLAWSLVVGFLALALFWMFREWAPFWPGGPARKRRREAAKRETTSVTVSPIVPDIRPDYQVHADEGRFPEAIHALLLFVLFEISRWRKQPFGSALTSREIVTRAGLAEDGREALGAIVGTVEASLFGGVEVGRTNFEDCLVRSEAVLAARPGGSV